MPRRRRRWQEARAAPEIHPRSHESASVSATVAQALGRSVSPMRQRRCSPAEVTRSRSARAVAVCWRSPATRTPRPMRRAPCCPTRAQSSPAPASKSGSRRPRCNAHHRIRRTPAPLVRDGWVPAAGRCRRNARDAELVDLADPWVANAFEQRRAREFCSGRTSALSSSRVIAGPWATMRQSAALLP